MRVAVGAVVVWAPWGTPGPGKMVPSFFFGFLPQIHAPKVGPKIDSLLIHVVVWETVGGKLTNHCFSSSVPWPNLRGRWRHSVTSDLGRLLILPPLKITL